MAKTKKADKTRHPQGQSRKAGTKSKARLNDKVGQAKKIAKKMVMKKKNKKAIKKKPVKKIAKKILPKKVVAKAKTVAKKKVVKAIKKKSVKKTAKASGKNKKGVKKVAKKKLIAKKSRPPLADETKKGKKTVEPMQYIPTLIPVKPVSVEKPEKEKKKSKDELEEEHELMEEETYSWDSASFSDMKNYEPVPIYKTPEPPQPKFKGKKDNRTRYSDKELAEFRRIINEKLKEAERDYELLKNTLAHRDEQGTDDTSPTFKVLEDGSDAMSREEVAQLASRQEKYIQNLKNALIRIENKTYGICRVTGKLIPKERLRSVPHATLSIEAKLMQHS